MVDQLMTGDGWKKGSDGIWEKNGQPASFEVTTTAGNESRELTEQIWQSQLQAGRLRPEDQEPERRTCSSADRLPKGAVRRRALSRQSARPTRGCA